MRYLFLLVFILLLAACLPRLDQEQPETNPETNPAMNTEIESGQGGNPVEAPIQEPKVKPSPTVELTNLGPAPELTNEIWLNTDRPLRLADLKGKVVLLEMWTFG